MKKLIKRLIKRARLPILQDKYNSLDYDYVNIGIQMVPVSNIVGLSDGRVDDYDDNWMPFDKDNQRWIQVYNGYKNNEPVPSIPLLKTPDGYYYANGDGNHRISAAKVLGLNQVQAKITVLVPKDAKIEEQWFEYSQDKQNKLIELNNQYNNIFNEIYKAQDDDNEQLENQLKQQQNSIGKEMNQLDKELKSEEKQFKRDLLNKYLAG